MKGDGPCACVRLPCSHGIPSGRKTCFTMACLISTYLLCISHTYKLCVFHGLHVSQRQSILPRSVAIQKIRIHAFCNLIGGFKVSEL